MGSSSKKTNSIDNASSLAVSTPTNPSWTTDPMQSYAARISDLMKTGGDGRAFVAPTSPLQAQAFSGAGQLGSWQGTIAKAMGYVGQATGAPAPTYAATGYGASPAAPTVTGAASGYNASTIGASPTIAATAGAGAGHATASLVKDLMSGSNLGGYLNPETNAVVNTTLQGMDKQAGVDQAALAAKQALTGAFGGSGAAIESANLTNGEALNRAQMEASLRQQAFDRAAGLATTDAGAMTGVSQSNAANDTQAGIANAGIAASRATAQAQLELAVRSGDQAAINAARQRVSDAQNAMTQQGVAATNTAALDAAGRADTASGFTAGATNEAARANQASLLQTLQNLLSGGQITGALAGQQASGAINDLSTQATLGGQQRAVDADQRDAPLNFSRLLQNLTGYNPQLFTGSTQSKNSTETKNTTETSTPSLLSQIGQGVGIGAQLFGLPGGSAGMNSLLSSFTGKQDPLNLDDPRKLVAGLGG